MEIGKNVKLYFYDSQNRHVLAENDAFCHIKSRNRRSGLVCCELEELPKNSSRVNTEHGDWSKQLRMGTEKQTP